MIIMSFLVPFVFLLGFIGTSSAVDPDFSCNFGDIFNRACGITQETSDQGDWEWSFNLYRVFYVASFKWRSSSDDRVKCYLPNFASRFGRMTFSYYSANWNGHLEVSVCADGTDVRTFSGTSGNWRNEEIDISCSTLMKISLTAVQDHASNAPSIGVDNINVYEIFPPSTTTPVPTTTMSTTTLATTDMFVSTSTSSQFLTPISSRPSTSNTTSSVVTTQQPGFGEAQGGQSTTIISVSAVVVVVLVIAVIAVCIVILRRRNGAAKAASQPNQHSPSARDNAYMNSAYSSEVPDNQQPDVVKVPGGNSKMNDDSGGYADVLKPPGGDEEYSYAYTATKGHHGRNNTGAVGSDSALNDHSYQSVEPKGDAVKGNTNPRNNGPDYFVLEPLSTSQYQEQRPVEPETSRDDTYHHLNHDGTSTMTQLDDGYGVVCAASQGEHSEETYNTLDHGGVALDVNKAKKPQARFRKGVNNEVDSEYNTLGLVDDVNQRSPPTPDIGTYGVLDENPATATGESNDAYDVLHQSSKTTPEKAKRQASRNDDAVVDDYNVLHSGREVGDYHQYQDLAAKDRPIQSSQHGTLDDEDYNVLHSGKEVSDYHLYQATEPPKDSDDVYYSAIKEQNPKGNGPTQHEPIYSDEVYSDFNQ